MEQDLPIPRGDKEAGSFSKRRYKFWVLAAILLMASWSMFTGTVTLKWSAGNLIRMAVDTDSRVLDEHDILEVEERKKVVRHVWDVYKHQSHGIRLPRFWLQAFQAAYEQLACDDPGVRDAAITEIAKMSLHSFHLETEELPLQSKEMQKDRISRKMEM